MRALNETLQWGKRVTGSLNFIARSITSGVFEICRGTLEAPGTAVMRINADGGGSFQGPCFSAYQSVAQSLGGTQKLTFTSKEFDLTGAYDTATSRFKPSVAGYYLVTACFGVVTTQTGMQAMLYKNGALAKGGAQGGNFGLADVTAVVYLNGDTDYLEVFGTVSAGQASSANVAATYFQAHLVRVVAP